MQISLYSANSLGYGGSIAFIVIGIVCIILGVAFIFIYRWNRRRLAERDKSDFLPTNRRFSHQIFSFWAKYAYFFIIVVAFIVGIIFIPVGVGYFF